MLVIRPFSSRRDVPQHQGDGPDATCPGVKISGTPNRRSGAPGKGRYRVSLGTPPALCPVTGGRGTVVSDCRADVVGDGEENWFVDRWARASVVLVGVKA